MNKSKMMMIAMLSQFGTDFKPHNDAIVCDKTAWEPRPHVHVRKKPKPKYTNFIKLFKAKKIKAKKKEKRLQKIFEDALEKIPFGRAVIQKMIDETPDKFKPTHIRQKKMKDQVKKIDREMVDRAVKLAIKANLPNLDARIYTLEPGLYDENGVKIL